MHFYWCTESSQTGKRGNVGPHNYKSLRPCPSSKALSGKSNIFFKYNIFYICSIIYSSMRHAVVYSTDFCIERYLKNYPWSILECDLFFRKYTARSLLQGAVVQMCPPLFVFLVITWIKMWLVIHMRIWSWWMWKQAECVCGWHTLGAGHWALGAGHWAVKPACVAAEEPDAGRELLFANKHADTCSPIV